MVSCRTVPLTATSQSVSSRPGTQDFVEKTGQVLRIDFDLKKRLIRSISVSTCKINIIVFYNKAFQDTMKFLILILTSHDVYIHRSSLKSGRIQRCVISSSTMTPCMREQKRFL